MSKYAIGIDYGTNSVRALIVDTASGEEIATSVFPYPSGQDGVLLSARDPNLARQFPGDYVEGFYACVRGALEQAARRPGFSPDQIVGIGVDTTGSTPIPVDRNCAPLAFQEEFSANLAAQAWLWKDHTAHEEARLITEKARATGEPYLAKCGGAYSSEWFWAKIWRCERVAPEVFRAAYSWLECCDYIPAFLTGQTEPLKIRRSACAAGHKAMHNQAWGGLPTREFLASLSLGLAELRDRLYTAVCPSDRVAGRLIAEVAARAGLPAGIAVAVGAIDAHMGAVGAGIAPGVLVKIIGTSTCDIMVQPFGAEPPDVPGLCGIANESVLPGMFGLEAGQAAVGDLFNWFVKSVSLGDPGEDRHQELTDQATVLKPGESGLIALDWNNGNRNVLVDPLLSGVLVGQTLRTTDAEIYRALIEATALGALTIIRRLEEYGIKVEQIVSCGGIAEKSPFLMQVYADVCDRPMKTSRSGQTCALGAAVFGAVVAGVHPDVPAAQRTMTGHKNEVFTPNSNHRSVYDELYTIYMDLHDAFGGVQTRDLGSVMKRLHAIRSRALRTTA